MKISLISILCILLSIFSQQAFSKTGWANDVLVAHTMEGINITGPGYSNFNCMYNTNDDMLVTFVRHQTTGLGDILTINKSFNNGYTWPRTNTEVKGGTVRLVSPSFAPIPGTDSLIVAIINDFPEAAYPSQLSTYKYTYSTDVFYHSYSQADYSYPGAGEPISCLLIGNEIAGEVWLFAESDNNWLFLTRSSDGTEWSASVPVSADVVRPSAVVAVDGRVAVTWLEPSTNNIMCSISDVSANFQPAVVVSENASEMASPYVAWEHSGGSNIGIVWHGADDKSYISISQDDGLSWSDGELLGEGDGIYPYINNFPGTRRMGVCYTTLDGNIKVANALTLAAASASTYTVRNHNTAYIGGAARVAYGEEPGQIALFFLSSSTQDLWITSSRFYESGIEESHGNEEIYVTVTPNPTGGFFTLDTQGFIGNVQFTLYSLDGRVIERSSETNGSFSVDGTQLPAGIYNATASGDGKTISCRVVRF